MTLLCQELESDEIIFRVKETRTLIFLKGWTIEADINQKWSLPLLHANMGRLLLMARQTGVSLEGCGAFMHK